MNIIRVENYQEMSQQAANYIIFLKNGQPIEFVKSVYRADRYKFVIDIKRK